MSGTSPTPRPGSRRLWSTALGLVAAAALAVGIGALVGLLILWIGPGATANKRAVDRVLRASMPGRGASFALVMAIGIAVAAILLVVWRYPVLDWWPLDTPPTRGL